MKKLQLTTWERVSLAATIAQQRGNLGQMRRFIRLLDVLELSDEERAAVGWRQQGEVMRWQDEEREFVLEFEDADCELLCKTALEFNSWLVSRLTVRMLEKLEVVR